MAKKGGIQRLRKELQLFQKEPAPYIQVAVMERNMFEWHYLIEGPPDTPYHGGWYYGRIKFADQYPYSPPGILMTTPSGRFQTDTRICLSMSDFHPETWNPMWSVATVLTGLLSFMTGTDMTTGAVETSEDEKKRLARSSMAWNMRHPTFAKYFPGAQEYARRRALGEDVQVARIRVMGDDDEDEGGEDGDSGKVAGAGGKGGEGSGKKDDGHAEVEGDAQSSSPDKAAARGQEATDETYKMTSADFSEGEEVAMSGLSSKNAHFNGIHCKVMGPGEKGRVRVLLQDQRELLMKPGNLVRVPIAGATSDDEKGLVSGMKRL